MKLIKKYDFQEIIKKLNIKNISIDSRMNLDNSIFIAVKGFKLDANNYIRDVISKKYSVAAITDDEDVYDILSKEYDNIFLVENSRIALAEISTIIYNDSPEKLLAVTGTNGKSSVVHYIYSISKMLNKNSASVGTLGVKYHVNQDEHKIDLSLTSPDSITFNKILQKLSQKKVEICAVEASSIGLDQHRLHGRKFVACGFTSFSQDHIDYHKNFENYLSAKLKLFKDYMNENSTAIINSDMFEFSKVKDFLDRNKIKYLTVGKNGDLKFKITNYNNLFQEFEVEYRKKIYRLKTDIIGEFQIYNILISCLMLSCCGFDIAETFSVIEKLNAPEGRLEKVSKIGKGANIIIDFAHTSDALENILKEIVKLKSKDSKVICVFGCGGDRDKSKRPLMGTIADKYSDVVIVTDDNPRFEDPSKIRLEIAEAIIKNKPVIVDGRKKAIHHALDIMEENDIVVIAGKGHENYQIIKDEKMPLSDKKIVEEYLKS